MTVAMGASVQINDLMLAGGAFPGSVPQFVVIIVSIIPQFGAMLSV
ncbi:MAG TPA: hypothetical protein VMN38_08255 [Sphingomicrobium sp.]|nr:hypothetical protein [Sphingomicrobium sp.]